MAKYSKKKDRQVLFTVPWKIDGLKEGVPKPARGKMGWAYKGIVVLVFFFVFFFPLETQAVIC